MTEESQDPGLTERANELYWSSDRSVNQIAEDLDLSKGRLYGVVEPLPSGLPCPDCGEELLFPNRTAREKGFLTCGACGLEEEEDAVRRAWDDAAAGVGRGAVIVTPDAMEEARGQGLLKRSPDLSRLLLGSALLGVAAGIAVATFFKKR